MSPRKLSKYYDQMTSSDCVQNRSDVNVITSHSLTKSHTIRVTQICGIRCPGARAAKVKVLNKFRSNRLLITFRENISREHLENIPGSCEQISVSRRFLNRFLSHFLNRSLNLFHQLLNRYLNRWPTSISTSTSGSVKLRKIEPLSSVQTTKRTLLYDLGLNIHFGGLVNFIL